MMSEEISKRLRASVAMNAVNGDSFERGVCAKQMIEAAATIESQAAELSAPRERVKVLMGLLGEIPNDYCPHCGDGSGGYPVPDGRGDFYIQQCQWCYEREALLSTRREEG